MTIQIAEGEDRVGRQSHEMVGLDWRTDGSVDDQLWEDAKSSADTEENGVEVLLGKPVVLEKDSRVRVNVGVTITVSIHAKYAKFLWSRVNIRVLGLAMLSEDAWGDLVHLGYKLEHRVVWQVHAMQRPDERCQPANPSRPHRHVEHQDQPTVRVSTAERDPTRQGIDRQ